MKELIESIKNKNKEKIKEIFDLYKIDVDFSNMKLVIKNKDELKKKSNYWDTQQYVRKILLNSLYGAILNENCMFYDKRIGQSVTLTGRMITKFMSEKINEIITGEKDYLGDAIIYGDTDSVDGSSIIHTNQGDIKIEELFEKCKIKWKNGEKYYSCDDDIKILSYDGNDKKPKFYNFNYVYKHEVEKNFYRVIDEFNNEIIITEDHSIMVDENGILKEVKPSELNKNMKLIIVNFNSNSDDNFTFSQNEESQSE